MHLTLRSGASGLDRIQYREGIVSTSGAGGRPTGRGGPRCPLRNCSPPRAPSRTGHGEDLTAAAFESDEVLNDFLTSAHIERHRDLARSPAADPVILDID
jgi:hypothetical protein